MLSRCFTNSCCGFVFARISFLLVASMSHEQGITPTTFAPNLSSIFCAYSFAPFSAIIWAGTRFITISMGLSMSSYISLIILAVPSMSLSSCVVTTSTLSATTAAFIDQ